MISPRENDYSAGEEDGLCEKLCKAYLKKRFPVCSNEANGGESATLTELSSADLLLVLPICHEQITNKSHL